MRDGQKARTSPAGDNAAPQRLRAAQRELTRSRIVNAAQACFTAKGVAATGFDEIAERAGVSRATLYLHFPNKNAVLLQLLGLRLGEVDGLYARLADQAIVDETTVVAWLTRYSDSVRRHRDLLPLFGMGLSGEAGLSDIVGAHRRNVIAILGRRFATFDLARDGPDQIPARTARAMLMILQVDQAAALAGTSPAADPVGRAVLALAARALADALGEEAQ